MEKLSIGQMAKLNQTTIQALRLYDELNLFKPIEINEETGYRYYDVKQCAQLDMIHYMKSTGMTLKEIKQVFDQKDFELLSKILHQRWIDIDHEINALTLQKKAVKRMEDSFNRYLKSPSDGTITLEYIDERKIYTSTTGVNFYEYGMETYESILKELKNEMIQHGVSSYYYYNAGTTIQKEDFIQKRCISHEIFVFVDQDCTSTYLHDLPSNLYLCMYCDDFEKESTYIQKLHDYINQNNLTVIGDYLCEVLTELPMTKTNKREMFLRLQVPVEFVKN